MKTNESMINVVNPIHRKGIKIVEINSNKKVSDIFNVSKVTVYQTPDIGHLNKMKLIEVSERKIEEKLRSVTPFLNGQRNDYFRPQNLNSSLDFGTNKDRRREDNKMNKVIKTNPFINDSDFIVDRKESFNHCQRSVTNKSNNEKIGWNIINGLTTQDKSLNKSSSTIKLNASQSHPQHPSDLHVFF